jgi:hypothetical protein
MDVKLFVALQSTHGVMQTQFLPGIMDLFKWRKYGMNVNQYIDPYIVLGRNTAATDFLNTDCTHFFTLDLDMVFTAEQHVQKLIDDDVDFVGGLYCKKAQGKIQWVCNALPERPKPDERGLLALRHIGTGFLMVKRVVFEKMIEAFGEQIKYYEAEINTPRYDFFDMPREPDEKGVVRKVSEDYHFCNQARRLGFTVYADTHVIVRHIGNAIYPLDTQVIESRNERDHGLA